MSTYCGSSCSEPDAALSRDILYLPADNHPLMQTILVVHSVDTCSAQVWLCVTDVNGTPPAVTVRLSNGVTATATSCAWKPVTADGVIPNHAVRTFSQVVTINGLCPGTRMIASANEAQAKFSTLPGTLPRFGDRPLAVLLGSCYYKKRDRGVASLMKEITREVQPDLKFLCGDQVYLDFPSFLLGIPYNRRLQARLFLSKYLQNWGDPQRLGAVLKEGATWFCADDHEYWNNFPNAATLISATWNECGRAQYRRIAGSLYDSFQNDSPQNAPCRKFRIDPLDFMVVDTRSGRRRGDSKFMTSDGFHTLTDWIENLQGPGVLVIGQPLFMEPHTGHGGWFRRRLVDRNLADYRQYDRLANSLIRGKHSILVLSGDVHFPRLAQAVRSAEGRRSIYEVIASPAALVFGNHSQTECAPDWFPAKPNAPSRLRVRTSRASRYAGDNLATLEFSQVPGQVRVKLKYWYVQTVQSGPTLEFALT